MAEGAHALFGTGPPLALCGLYETLRKVYLPMKGNFKILVIDLNSNNILVDANVDEINFNMNRPLEPEYGSTPETWGRPTGFRQTGPTVWSVEGKQSAEAQ